MKMAINRLADGHITVHDMTLASGESRAHARDRLNLWPVAGRGILRRRCLVAAFVGRDFAQDFAVKLQDVFLAG